MLRKRLLYRLAGVALLGLSPAWCQSTTDPLAAFRIGTNIAVPGFDPADFADVFGAYRQPFIDYLNAKTSETTAFAATFRSMLKAVENGRVDEQEGGSPSAGGTVTAAERAGITGLLTAAIESGAMSQTFDQNVLTLRANGEGLYRFLSGKEVLPMCLKATDTSCDPSPLNNLELAASFDVSGTSAQAVTGVDPKSGTALAALLTSNRRQLSSFTARYVILNPRDLRSPAYRKVWLDWYNQNRPGLLTAGAALLKSLDDVANTVASTDAKDAAGKPVPGPHGNMSVYDVWLLGARVALKAAPRTEAGIGVVLAAQLDLLDVEMRKLVPDLDTRIDAANKAYTQYFDLTRKGIALANLPMLTVQAGYLEPALQPKLFNATVVFAWSPKGKGTVNPGTFTLNGGMSMYTKAEPSDAKGSTTFWHDGTLAAQFDRALGGGGAPAMFSLGTYIQYQASPGLIDIPAGTMAPGTNVVLPGNATMLLAKQGTIAVVQASLTLHLPNSGIKVPIGISWSNRTELVTGHEIRAHLGFNFDSHSLLLAGK